MNAFTGFLEAMVGSSTIEWIAVGLGLVNITLLIRRSIWNYPFGIAMVTLYAWIFFEAKLYSDAGLQIFFIVVQLYGWVHWSRRRDLVGKVIVRRLRKIYLLVCALAGLAGTAALGFVMARYTDAVAPFWDASIAVFSVIAQILLARRYLENWLVWVIVNCLAIGLYWTRGLEPTAALYGMFLILAIFGFFEWRRARAAAPVAR